MQNVGRTERWITGAAGAGLAVFGFTRRSRAGGLLVLAGGGLMYSALRGRWSAYAALLESRRGKSTAEALSGDRGVIVQHAVTIRRPADEVFAFWRDFENLPRFMENVRSVHIADRTRSHWVVRAPAGTDVEWDAEVINEVPGRVIGWRTLEGADVLHAGSVNFREKAGGTEVRVRLQYDPPAGKLGEAIASMLGASPTRQIAEDLERLKELLEARDQRGAQPEPLVARA